MSSVKDATKDFGVFLRLHSAAVIINNTEENGYVPVTQFLLEYKANTITYISIDISARHNM